MKENLCVVGVHVQDQSIPDWLDMDKRHPAQMSALLKSEFMVNVTEDEIFQHVNGDCRCFGYDDGREFRPGVRN